ncbi:MAG: FliH/SctL family protein [Planctomycetota bacterium]
MVEFRVQFDTTPASVTTPVGKIAPTESSTTAEPSETIDASAAIQTVDNVLIKIAEIERVTQQRLTQFNNQVIHIATQVARSIVRFDEDFVQERVCQYVAAALDEIPNVRPDAVVVHPSCAASVRSWIEQSPHGDLAVREDASIAPGDCLVDTDAGGVAAMMDAHLEAFMRRFNEQMPPRQR